MIYSPAEAAHDLRQLAQKLDRTLSIPHIGNELRRLAERVAFPPDLWVDVGSRELHIAGDILRLTPHHTAMLEVLLRRGPVVSYETLAAALWGAQEGPQDARRNIAVYATQLRKLLKPRGWNLKCAWGKGIELRKIAVDAEEKSE